MEIIKLPRGMGKTSTLVDLAKRNNGCIVVGTRREKDRLKSSKVKVVTVSEAINGALRGTDYTVYVDNIDNILFGLVGREVDMVTVNKESDK